MGGWVCHVPLILRKVQVPPHCGVSGLLGGWYSPLHLSAPQPSCILYIFLQASTIFYNHLYLSTSLSLAQLPTDQHRLRLLVKA